MECETKILGKKSKIIILLFVLFSQSSFAKASVHEKIQNIISQHLKSVEQFKLNLELKQAGQDTKESYFEPSHFEISDMGYLQIGDTTYKLKGKEIYFLPEETTEILSELSSLTTHLEQAKQIHKTSAPSAAIPGNISGSSGGSSGIKDIGKGSSSQSRSVASDTTISDQNASEANVSSTQTQGIASTKQNKNSLSQRTVFDSTSSDTTEVDSSTSDPTQDPTVNINFASIENSTTGFSISSKTVSTELKFPVKQEQLYVTSITYTDSMTSVQSVQGLGLNWVQDEVQCGINDALNIEIWHAVGTPLFESEITAEFTQDVDSAIISAIRIDNFDIANPIGKIIRQNVNGIDVDASCGQGANSKEYSAPIEISANNALVLSFIGFDKNKNSLDDSVEGTEHYDIAAIDASSKLQSALTSYERKNTDVTDIEGKLHVAAIWAHLLIEINSAL